MKQRSISQFSFLLAIILMMTSCKTSQTTVSTPTTPTPPIVSTSGAQKDPNKNYAGDYEQVASGKYDNGKMWTFSYPPVQYFKETYGFEPSAEWLESVRKSALRFATYCTASFVSADGLVMTNHHCGRESVTSVNKTGEDLPRDGFYAPTLADERKVDELFVDQLVSMQDVTNEIMSAMAAGKTDEEKNKLRNEKISSLVKENEAKSGLKIQIHDFYNGSIFQMYGYKTYTDVRLVMAPETDLGFFGGDPDNFTYPRYCLDYTFFRVYDETGKPLQTQDYFRWSQDGPKGEEPVFVVGNPGTTKRLITMSMLEYERDYAVPITLDLLSTLTKSYWDYIEKNPSSKLELMDTYFGYSNGLKAYTGFYKDGLKNSVMMGKRADFENKFKAKVQSNPQLNAKYGSVWSDIQNNRDQMKKYFGRQVAFNTQMANSELLSLASRAVALAKEAKTKEANGTYSTEMQAKIDKLTTSPSYHAEIEENMVAFALRNAYKNLGRYHPLVQNVPNEASIPMFSKSVVKNSILGKKGELQKLFANGPNAVLTSDDPMLKYALMASDSLPYYRALLKPLSDKESGYIQKLGQAFYEVYGTGTPPDANFTLRIADGVVKNYEYNGTTAPDYTTFFGLYDRYYSYGQTAPWDLPARWKNPPADFKMNTKMNFVTTNDIIGGNSGSAMVNKNKEVVGLIFDGNIESLPGRYIFDSEAGNRCVTVHSSGILESLRAIYKADRLVNELKNSRIVK